MASQGLIQTTPERLDVVHAASYGASYRTAYVALVRRARVTAGEWVLVHGAAGGVGLACVDLARALGCRVIAASASDDKLAVVPELLLELRETVREKLEVASGDWLTEANSPSWLNLNTVVWAVRTRGVSKVNVSKVTTNSRLISFLLSALGSRNSKWEP